MKGEEEMVSGGGGRGRNVSIRGREGGSGDERGGRDGEWGRREREEECKCQREGGSWD